MADQKPDSSPETNAPAEETPQSAAESTTGSDSDPAANAHSLKTSDGATPPERPAKPTGNQPAGKKPGSGDPPSRRGLPGWMLIVFFLSGLFFLALWSNGASNHGTRVPYGVFLRELNSGNVQWVEFRENDNVVVGEWKKAPEKELPTKDDAEEIEYTKRFNASVSGFEDREVIDLLIEKEVYFESEPPSISTAAILFNILPLILFIWLLWFFFRRSSDPMGSGGMFGNFVRSPAKRIQPDDKLATFDDVAGMEGPKGELQEVVEFLRTPQKFLKLGAEIPKGVLMSGPPGTGKTLLGRATAGEAGVAFFSINGSEFIQMFVGVGASRVRDMFKTARESAPCILFIDEIDAIGRVRGAGVGGGHDEREQTLNQILSEMDGFSQSEAVIVIGATNRPDVLDPALLRPGRFDRKVEVDRPGKKGRVGILKVHSRKVPLDDSVDLEEIASGTIGFSGAELKNLVNEAALRAVRLNKTKVDQEDLLDAFEKVTLGVPRDEKFNEDDTRATAYHEAGHALLAWFVPHVDPVYKVSIVPRGRTGGVMWSRPDEELMTQSEVRLRGQMAVAMGGRAAEKLVFDELNSGASNDLQQATRIARAMVGKLGMSEVIGPVAFDQSEDHPFLGREMGEHSRKYSEETAHLMDQEVQRLLIEAEERAVSVLTEHRDKLETLAQLLLDNEVVDRQQLTEVIGEPAERTRGRVLDAVASRGNNGDGDESDDE